MLSVASGPVLPDAPPSTVATCLRGAGLNQAPDLPKRDRERGEVGPAAVDDVAEQAQTAVRRRLDRLRPAGHLLVPARTGCAGPQDLGRDGRMDDVQILTEGGSGEALPAVVARQVEYPAPQPVQLQVLVECEIDLGHRADGPPGGTGNRGDVEGRDEVGQRPDRPCQVLRDPFGDVVVDGALEGPPPVLGG